MRAPFAVLAAAVILGAFTTPARADEISEKRDVSGFDRVRLEGAFTTQIRAGESGTRVIVTASSDVIGRITTDVRSGTLIVGMRPGIPTIGRSPKLQIALPALRSFSNTGFGSTKITGLAGGDIDLENKGAGSIVAAGRAARENIVLDGTGKIDATAVEARDVTVDNSGVGSVRVRASGLLTMSLNGVGEIRYTGDPAHIQSHVNGIGRISRI